MGRARGLSVRFKLTLSYAGFLMLAGVLLLAAVWVFLLRYVPDGWPGLLGIAPNRYLLLVTFAPAAAIVLAFLLVFGLVGGWVLAGRMLAPLTRITDATRLATNGSLSHRIRLEGRRDEFRELADAFDTMLARLETHVAEQQAVSPSRPPARSARSTERMRFLLQMTTNLVHNAIVHNLPERGIVQVAIGVHPETVVLTVENSGERLTPELVATLTEPFQRGTGRARDDHAGVGLGLAIVKRITQVHDGSLTIVPRPAGGLRVVVELPASRRPGQACELTPVSGGG